MLKCLLNAARKRRFGVRIFADIGVLSHKPVATRDTKRSKWCARRIAHWCRRTIGAFDWRNSGSCRVHWRDTRHLLFARTRSSPRHCSSTRRATFSLDPTSMPSFGSSYYQYLGSALRLHASFPVLILQLISKTDFLIKFHKLSLTNDRFHARSYRLYWYRNLRSLRNFAPIHIFDSIEPFLNIRFY